MASSLTLQQQRVYNLLKSHTGQVVTYADFESVICCKRRGGRTHLAVVIMALRKHLLGRGIRSIRNIGYILKEKHPMTLCQLSENDAVFASEFQDAMCSVMTRHSELVDLESQIAIMQIAIGSIINQLPEKLRKYYIRMAIRNLTDAAQLAEVMRLQ